MWTEVCRLCLLEEGDVQDIPRLDDKAPPGPDSAGSDERGVGVEGELFGWTGKVGDTC